MQMACALGRFLYGAHVKKGYSSISGGCKDFLPQYRKILVLQPGSLMIYILT